MHVGIRTNNLKNIANNFMDPQRYDELHGTNNWDDLLDPLDLDLRNLLIGYGDLVSAAERAFNNDEGSPYNGYSYYGKSLFFKGVMLPWAESKYRVTSFIYATSRANSLIPVISPGSSHDGSEFEANWMGYIAVSNDEYSKSIGCREICVVWRGTLRSYEFIDDTMGAMLVSAEPLFPSNNSTGAGNERLTGKDAPQVMGGWLTIYTTSDPNSKFINSSAQTQLLARIKELLVKHKDENVSVTCTGHSLGACLAVLSAFDLARNVVTPNINVSAFIFASPLVGNQSFKTKMLELPNLKVISLKNDQDLVTFWPGKIVKWASKKVWESMPASGLTAYSDVGVKILLDNNKSPYVKDASKLHPLMIHNLQGMLHTLSGWNGKNGEFDWSLVKRSLGWVNMSTDLLKQEFQIPANWWTEKNKGMVLNDDGDWVLSPFDLHDHDLQDRDT